MNWAKVNRQDAERRNREREARRMAERHKRTRARAVRVDPVPRGHVVIVQANCVSIVPKSETTIGRNGKRRLLTRKEKARAALAREQAAQRAKEEAVMRHRAAYKKKLLAKLKRLKKLGTKKAP